MAILCGEIILPPVAPTVFAALFGSVVRNEQTEESDVDIAYEGEANLLLRSRMKQELESLFGCRVDIIRLRKQLVDSVFGQNIENDLIYV